MYDEKWLGDDTKHEISIWRTIGVIILSIVVQALIGAMIVGIIVLMGSNK